MKVFKHIYYTFINVEAAELEKTVPEGDKLEQDLKAAIELKLILQNNLLM